jgi:molybdenum cofactor biosynthesis enzyme
MQIKDGLVRSRKRAVESVCKHRLTLGAVLSVARLKGLCAAELVEVCHLNHLPFYTL